ncbi:MAG: nuclear transport factor 2 family protein [Pseudomonadota bacterium]
MPAKTPEQCNSLLLDALTQGDLDAAMALYEPDASFVTEQGVVTGDAIRAVLEGFAGIKPSFDYTPKPSVVNGNIALTGNNWTVTGTDPDGNAVEMSGSSAEVLRQGADGNWRFLIDNPNAP